MGPNLGAFLAAKWDPNAAKTLACGGGSGSSVPGAERRQAPRYERLARWGDSILSRPPKTYLPPRVDRSTFS